MRKRQPAVLLIFLLLSFGLISELFAQAGRGTGRIRGTVSDAQGNPLQGVKIVATNLKFQLNFETTSDEKGNWALGGLGSEYYRITANKEGYEMAVHEMSVSQFYRNNPPVDFIMKKLQKLGADIPEFLKEENLVEYEEAMQLFEQKRYGAALAIFEEFLGKYPEAYQVNINIGNCYREMGEHEKAMQAFQIVIDKILEEKGSLEGDETAAKALASIGETHMDQGEFEKARELFEKAVGLFPEDATMAYKIAEIYFKRGDTDKGIEYYKLAIQFKDDWGPPYRQLGYAYLNKGEYELAVEAFNKYIELEPDSPQAATIENLIPQLKKMIKKTL